MQNALDSAVQAAPEIDNATPHQSSTLQPLHLCGQLASGSSSSGSNEQAFVVPDEKEVWSDAAGAIGLPQAGAAALCQEALAMSEGAATLPDIIIQAAASAACVANSNPKLASDAAVHAMGYVVSRSSHTSMPDELQPQSEASACKAQFEYAGVLDHAVEAARQLHGGYASHNIVAEQLQAMTACFYELCREVTSLKPLWLTPIP